MVPGLEALEDVSAIQCALVLASLRGIGERTWLRHAPILRASGAWSAHLSDVALERVYLYALRAGQLRHSLEVYRLPSTPRLLPFAAWWSLGHGPGACHSELDGRAARVGDTLWERFMPPLGYDCSCGVAVISAARARREGPPELSLCSADLERLAPAGWVGEPPPVKFRDERAAHAAIACAQAMLAAAGLDWPQRLALSAGVRLRPD